MRAASAGGRIPACRRPAGVILITWNYGREYSTRATKNTDVANGDVNDPMIALLSRPGRNYSVTARFSF